MMYERMLPNISSKRFVVRFPRLFLLRLLLRFPNPWCLVFRAWFYGTGFLIGHLATVNMSVFTRQSVQADVLNLDGTNATFQNHK